MENERQYGIRNEKTPEKFFDCIPVTSPFQV